MSYKICFYPERCVACGACAVACMDQNDVLMPEDMSVCSEKKDDPKIQDTEIFPLRPSQVYGSGKDLVYRRVYQIEYQTDSTAHIGYFSAACHHCEDAPCIAACPANCLSKDPDTGFTVYDNTGCIGCRSCSMACPHGAPATGVDGKMVKCDGCNERVKVGLLPACVAVCPFDALQLEEEPRT